MKTRISTGLITAGLLAAVTVPVNAQQRQIEEVIVTAQKRTESSQDVPVALTAIGSDMMQKTGITGTQDLTKLSPSLTTTTANSKQNSGFRLRGVGTSAFSVGVEQSVAVIIDDVSTVQAGQSISNLVDIQRVEILRGPQSTLFGKSASAGVVSIFTKPPSEEFGGSVELSLTDDDEERVLASISGPISDSVGYRLTGNWSDRDGFIKNLTLGEDVNGDKSKGVRGKLRWDVSDSTEVMLTAYYSDDESTCCAATWLDLDPTAQVFGFVPGVMAPGITPSDDNLEVLHDNETSDKAENSGVNLRVIVGMGEFTLTSITATDTWEYSNTADVDLTALNVAAAFTGGAINGGFFQEGNTETDFVSQEFRLASPAYENHDYLLGFYYADAETERAFERNRGLPVIRSNWAGTSTTESMAVFGQLNWRFSDATSATFGLRYNKENIKADFVNNLRDPDKVISGDDSDSVVVGAVSLQHFLNDEVMLYARYARGYKGQAFDITNTFSETKAEMPAAPETSNAFEIGIKSELLDGLLQLNATAFYTEYEDFQAQSSFLLPDGTFLTTLNNVGVMETKGLELEGVALIGDNLTLTFGAAYIDAVIEEFEEATCYAGQDETTGCVNDVQNISGGELPNSPDWKWNVVADYHLELEAMPFYGFVNFSYVWQDEINFDLLQNPLRAHDSYGIGDFNIGITEKEDDRYRITLFVNNVTDENYRGNITDARQITGGKTALAQIFPRNSQRYYGIRAKFKF